MSDRFCPRLDYLDDRVARNVLAHAETHSAGLVKLIDDEPGRLLQTRNSSLASDYKTIAWYSYALGFPLEIVALALSQSAHAHVRLFECREMENGFQAYSFVYDPAHAPGSPEAVVSFRELYSEKNKDYSSTNSKKCYDAICGAFVSTNEELAYRLAELMWDPPKASYISRGSFCTPNDQRLAFALRELLNGQHAAMELELKKLRLAKADAHIGNQATMLRAIAAGDSRRFVAGLIAFLAWHARKARSKIERLNPAFFF